MSSKWFKMKTNLKTAYIEDLTPSVWIVLLEILQMSRLCLYDLLHCDIFFHSSVQLFHNTASLDGECW